MDDGERLYRTHTSGGGTQTWTQIAQSEGRTENAVRKQAYRWAQKHVPTEHPVPHYTQKEPDDLTLDEFVELARRTQAAVDSVDPIFVTDTISLDADKPIGVIFCSCTHLGSRYVNHGAFVELLNKVLDIPRLYWMDLGDQIEGFTGFFDKRAAHEQALADPKLQRKMLAKVLDRLMERDKLLCGFAGQHGAIWEATHRAEDPVKRMYLERKTRYFDGQAFIKLDVGPERYRLFAAHEMPGNSVYNKNHPQKRAALWKAPTADMIVMGDKHTTSVQQESVDTFEYLAGERSSYQRWLVQVGTAKTGPDPYTIRSWSPGTWDWPIFIFRHDRHQIVQAADLDIAQMLLDDW